MARKPALLVAASLPDKERSVLFDKITAWKKADQAKAEATIAERDARMELYDAYFREKAKEGTNKISLGTFNGKRHELIADYKISRDVDEEQLTAAIQNETLTPSDVAELVKYKPSLRTTEYKALSDEDKLKWADIITEKPGMPGMKLHSVDTE